MKHIQLKRGYCQKCATRSTSSTQCADTGGSQESTKSAPTQIVSALGAAAGTQIPLTHRELSSTLILVTGNSRNAEHIANWPDALPSNATVVVYMPGQSLSSLQQRLLSSGVAPETPCAIISGATIESEQVHITSVRNLSAAPLLAAPRLLIVGEVVRFAKASELRDRFTDFAVGPQYSEVSPDTGENA